jgi:hypothetical protein
MLTAIAPERFRRFWKSFARTPHCDFHQPGRAYALQFFS